MEKKRKRWKEKKPEPTDVSMGIPHSDEVTLLSPLLKTEISRQYSLNFKPTNINTASVVTHSALSFPILLSRLREKRTVVEHPQSYQIPMLR